MAVIRHDSQADADGDLAAARLFVGNSQSFDGQAQLLGQPLCGRRVHARQDQQEFFTAVSRCQIAGPLRARLQGFRNGNQTLIAGLVTVKIVVFLEIIDINHDQGQRLAFALAVRQFSVQRGVEVATVVQSGQRIPAGLLTQLLLQGFNFLDIDDQGLVGFQQFLFTRSQLFPNPAQLEVSLESDIADHEHVAAGAHHAKKRERPAGIG